MDEAEMDALAAKAQEFLDEWGYLGRPRDILKCCSDAASTVVQRQMDAIVALRAALAESKDEQHRWEVRVNDLTRGGLGTAEWKGNSVDWWWSKATAYKNALGEIWGALNAAGIMADGKTHAKDGVLQLKLRAESAEQERDRLRNGGCARDQRLTQHCTYAQAAEQAKQIAERDAARYRWLVTILSASVGGGIEVNDERLVYEEPEPGKEVRLYWYPDTPVGFYESHGSTIDEAIDSAISAQLSGEER